MLTQSQRFFITITFLSFALLSVSCRTGSYKGLRKIVNHSFDRLEVRQFEEPESFYWPAFFWTWKDTVTKEIITEQLTDMARNGARSVCLHSYPKSFRPDAGYMEPDYMTPEYLDLWSFATEECRRLGMKKYLYDEGGWPSGSCLGRVVEQNPTLINQKLSRQVFTPEVDSSYSIPGDCLSAFLYQGDTLVRPLSPGESGIMSAADGRILIFSVITGDTRWYVPYPDLLNPESISEFLRLTHEEYKKVSGDHFGKTIHITFTDEVEVPFPGWTNDIVDEFKSKYGYDILNELPSIFEGDSEHDRRVRIDYYDWWSQRHADVYYGQIQEWCHENNLLSGGHLLGDKATDLPRKYSGHPLRVLRRMDVPGVDAIRREIFPGSKNHHYPKYASTVSHQSGMPWALTESFAGYGSGLTPAQMKWISDYQYVRGINLLVLSSYPSSKKGKLLSGNRRAFGPGDPLWQHMYTYHSYTARLGYLLSLGSPVIKTALYYPIRDIWAGGSDLASVCSAHDDLARILLENQCDFDLIDDDVLESNITDIVNGQLVVGLMRYDVVCVSRNRYMSEGSISKLQRFTGAGGKVLWVDDSYDVQRPKGITKTTISDLPSLLTPVIALKTPSSDIRVCKRELTDGALYFVTNEDTCSISCTLQFRETQQIVQLDPESGKCWKPSRAVRTSNGWEVPVDFAFAGSGVFIFTDDVLPCVPEPQSPGKFVQAISSGWTCRKVNEYVIGEHEIKVQDHTSEQSIAITLGDWSEVIGKEYSGDVEYQVSFTCTGSEAKSANVLDLGDVRYVCQVWINGESLGKRLWGPYSYDVKGKLKEGTNDLRVVVTNTLANQYANTKSLDNYPIEKIGPYHKTTTILEQESVAGGLYGPVTIM
jgi:hypothetical protein